MQDQTADYVLDAIIHLTQEDEDNYLDGHLEEDLTFEDVENLKMEDMPLYPGAAIALGAMMLPLSLFVTKHNLVGDGIQQLLNIIAVALPNGHNLVTTLSGFKRFFNNLKSPLIKHY